MLRQVVVFDEGRCNGCGLCVRACHEGAIGLVGGKAALLRDDFCDGMGDCLPACPMDAIRFETREALPYDEAAVQAARVGEKDGAPRAGVQAVGAAAAPAATPAGGLAGVGAPVGAVGWTAAPAAGVAVAAAPVPVAGTPTPGAPAPAPSVSWSAVPAGGFGPAGGSAPGAPASQLAQWPCQIKLVPPSAPYFQGASLLVAADCTAFAHPDFHRSFMAGRVTLVGCPKLDAVDYSEKLGAILSLNDVRDVLVARMDVPCCGGIQRAVAQAIATSGKALPARVVTLGRDGSVLREEPLA